MLALSRFVPLWVLFGLSVSVQAADWPSYLHDNTRVGATAEALNPPFTLRWVHHAPVVTQSAWEGPRSTPIEGQRMVHRVRFDDANHVAIVGDRAYFGSSVDHQVYCVDLSDGGIIWKFFTGGPVRLAPTVYDDRVYFGSDDGCVYCLKADDGRQAWKLRIGPKDDRLLARGRMISRWPVRTGVLIDDGIAYFGAGIFPHENIYLAAADAATGKVIWKNDHISQQDAGRNDLSPQGYLLANEDLLFVPSGRSLPAAFEKKSGKFVYKKSLSWRSSGGGVVGGSKAILNDGQLLSSGAHHFVGLDQKTGNAGFSFMLGEQMTFRGRIAYILNGQQLIAVDREKHAAASVARQKLYVKRRSYRSDRKKLAEVDKEMERLAQVGILWSQPFTGQSALIATGKHIIAGGMNVVTAFDIESGDQAWSSKVEGEARGLAAANGHLVVSTTAGKIYAFSESAHTPANFQVTEFPRAYDANPFEPDALTAVYENAVDQILKQTNVTDGFCLVLGSERGRLALELAKRTKLKIYGIESDEAKVAASREALARAGLYGHRVSIVHAEPSKTPLSNYFANLVVSDSMLLTGKLPASAVELGRYVKPCGGMACFGVPSDRQDRIDPKDLKESLAAMYLRDDAEIRVNGSWAILTRGKLADVGQWSHQYGNVANTCFTPDDRVRGSLGVLWYGDPGPQQMINRHEAASAPLSTNGRFFTQGTESVRAYDAYNGQFLWEYKNPGAIRTGVFNNYETSNMAASDDTLFVVVGDTCTALDAASGEIRHQYKALQADDGIPRHWGYVAHHDGVLYGTSTIRSELAAALRRRGRKIGGSTDGIFAYDTKSGKRLWSYKGKNIMHVTITIGDGRLYFVESSITPEERDALLRQDKTELKKLEGEARAKKEAELKSLDVRRVVALDAKTGEELWRKPVDVTFVSGVSAGGGNVMMMYHDGRLVVCGANANGHYWRQFLSGEFKRRRLVALDADTGEKLWARDADYMNRPAIIGDMVLAEPWAFELATGEEKKRVSPITGEATRWQYSRPGHHCGVVTATPNMMFFRSGFIGYYDLYEDSGTRHFAGQRLGCWVNALPSNGLVVIPEASAGCVCLFSITSTVVLEPRQDRNAAWGIYSLAGSQTPVKHLAINLGAPGDRRDQFGTLWLGYPRPRTVGRMEYTFDIGTEPKSAEYYGLNEESFHIEDADTPWLFSSGARGITRLRIPLLGKDDSPASYRVKLYFAHSQDSGPDRPRFSIRLQGDVVDRDIDLPTRAGGENKPLVLEFEGVQVARDLVVQLSSQNKVPTTICAIEVERESTR